ncbi:hypothetical protein P153DRAFT_369994 [Dothidotthia symphoricarpi CBS 119687]|uniref:Uncharacterized protein n=1 Tax=Dothidotthia symphoricarpi CBS 119687 TaxID=1392245 RepID=A0A6A6A2B7_9PLEO|nr:uncharacterized protein P153DRAFT_369994 [Dothidotthia symphoricarpi CBS 119687]KAF2125323.1 hypothetical protein P153DRAFT_369994 [Dothidotthia symphoricarpi CBS 119687]
MDSTSEQGNQEERRRDSYQRVESTRLDDLFRWFQHPFIMVLLPLIALLCAPSAYNILTNSSTSHNELQLQEIATLMNDIYVQLADMTFIPHTAIKQGPHVINTTSIPCHHDPSVLRLMELLPYVDTFEVRDDSWLYGGQFMDYRRLDHLQQSCDPLRVNSMWSHTMSSTLALTTWTNHEALVLFYDISRNGVRAFDGEYWIMRGLHRDKNTGKFGGIFSEPWRAHEQHDGFDQMTLFDAPTLLRRIIQACKELSWTPWETPYNANEQDVERGFERVLLRNNGWPRSFDSEQFNADLIRKKHTLFNGVYADATLKRVVEIDGKHANVMGPEILGYIHHAKHRLALQKQAIEDATDDDERWLFKWRVQRSQWDIEKHEAELSAAEPWFHRLCPESSCPDSFCVRVEGTILWELRSLERRWETLQLMNQTAKCNHSVSSLPDTAPPDPKRHENCVSQLRLEKYWYHLAYSQCHAQAVKHCATICCVLFSSTTLEERAKTMISKLEHELTLNTDLMRKMEEWRETLPEHATRALEEYSIENSVIVNRPWYIKEEIKLIEEQLKDGGDRYELAKRLEGEAYI